MDNNGFTLIELIGVVTVLGIVAVFSLPALGNIISDNSKRACQYYERSMVEASRSFIQKESTDIIESNGSFPASYILNVNKASYSGSQNLIDLEYLDEFEDERSMVTDAYVTVTYHLSSKTYTYTPHLKCLKKSGAELYTK